MGWLFVMSTSVAAPLIVRPQWLRRALIWLLPVSGIALLAWSRQAEPLQRLIAASLGMLYVMKASILLTWPLEEARNLRPIAFLLWPGMDPTRLANKREPSERDAFPIPRGLAFVCLGLALLLVAALAPLSPPLTGWAALVALLLILHFGLSEIISSGFRIMGFGVNPLFNQPFAARTLNEFWTRRWNAAFVEMDRRLFLPQLVRRLGYRRAIFGTFVISGLLHEMAISYPAGGGWGMPTAYFAIQGLLILAENRWKIRSRFFTWLAILGPLPLVFTSAFRNAFSLPLANALHAELASRPVSWYFDRGLWVMGIAHFLVLAASFQVPSKLNWREELPRLSSFNRKLMVAYGAFIVLTIVTFGIFTLAMHRELLAGSGPAMFFAGFIAVFWLLRIGIDCFYYKHEDWPRGIQFVIGHALLTSLFAFLCLTYTGLVVWHALT